MPPVTVTRIESDNEGGWFIEWHDAANLDGLPLTGFFHLTEAFCSDLVVHQRKPNRAPTSKLEACHSLILTGTPVQVSAAFIAAYEEVLADRIDRHNYGMKAVTSHGHADLEAVRQGAPVRAHNRVDPRPDGFKDFIKGPPQ